MARYDKMFLLGTGSYGKAWVVETQKPRKDKKVLKEINLKTLADKDVDQALTEVAILSRCCHENIISYSEAFVDKQTMTLSIVMEYASGGDLHKQISQRRGLYFPNEAEFSSNHICGYVNLQSVMRWFFQLLAALCYIHRRGILHRDIKPQNLFLTDKQVLKLGDFGISKILPKDGDVAFTFVGTPFYLSPEICQQQPYSFKSDMWAAGCVLYELCCLRVPFTATNLPSLAAQIQLGVYQPLPSHCSELLCHLVKVLLMSEPAKRPAADEIFQHLSVKDYLVKHPEVYPSSHALKEISNLVSRGRPHTRHENTTGKQKILDLLNKENEDAETKFGLGFEGVMKKNITRPVDSTTYTVVRHPSCKRLSLASPELSSMIQKQRLLTAENQRAHSVDAPRSHKSRKIDSAPKLSLLLSLQQVNSWQDQGRADNVKHSLRDDSSDRQSSTEATEAAIDHITELIYNSVAADKTPLPETALEIHKELTSALGRKTTDALISSVRNKMGYNDLKNDFDINPALLHSVLWYLNISGLKL